MNVVDTVEVVEETVEEATTKAPSVSKRSSRPKNKRRGKQRPIWWPEVIELRVKTRKLFNKSKNTRKPEDWNNYKAAFNKYKSQLKRVKNKYRSLESNCNVDHQSEASYSPSVVSSSSGSEGNWAKNYTMLLPRVRKLYTYV